MLPKQAAIKSNYCFHFVATCDKMSLSLQMSLPLSYLELVFFLLLQFAQAHDKSCFEVNINLLDQESDNLLLM